MADIPNGFIEMAIALTAGGVFTLIGIIYRKLKRRITELEETVGELESAIIGAKQELDTAQTWMFGQERDPTNVGISKEIQTIQSRLENTIDKLHDEDDLDFDRDDVESDD